MHTARPSRVKDESSRRAVDDIAKLPFEIKAPKSEN